MHPGSEAMVTVAKNQAASNIRHQSEIEEYLNRTANRSRELSGVIDVLRERLTPIIRQNPGGKPESGEKAIPREALSPVADSLRDLDDTTRIQVIRLMDIIEQLAV